MTKENYRFCSRCGEELAWERADYYCYSCRQQYNKQYKAKHKEYYKDWREQNREHIAERYKQWAEDNREHRKQYGKEWREARTQDHYLYLKKGNNVDLYAGSTKYKDRPIRHLKGQTHLGLDVGDWIELEIDKLLYVNITDYINTSSPETARAEREYLESLLITDLEPLLNNSIPEPKLEADRVAYLQDVYYNYLQDLEMWEVLPVKKITTPSGVAAFNFKSLVLE